MKQILLFFSAILLGILSVKAQDYQTVRSGGVAFFNNEHQNIQCIRIDSVAFQTDSVLFPSPNIQQLASNCFDPRGNSWIGKKVVIRKDGTNLFFNKDNDTIRIKTKARMNENWTVVERQDYIRVIAEIESVDTLTILGELDSVKTIGFQVYDNSGNAKRHYLNEHSLIISKNHGFVRIMNFNEFPEEPTTPSFQILNTYSLIGLANPDRGVQNLTRLRVFDFHPGDELHTLYEWSECCNKGDSTKVKTKLKYLERLDAADSIVYKVEREESIYKTFGKWDSTAYVFVHDTIQAVYKPDSLFDKLPGEPIISDHSAFAYTMINENPVSKRDYSIFDRISMFNDSCWGKIAGEACFAIPTYLEGLGGPYYSCENPEGAGGGESSQLVYYKKGSATWGSPLIFTGVKSLDKEDQFKVYPNPATDFVTIENSSGRLEKYELQLFDLQGKEIICNTIMFSNSYYLDLSALKEGAYVLKLQNGETQVSRKIVKKP